MNIDVLASFASKNKRSFKVPPFEQNSEAIGKSIDLAIEHADKEINGICAISAAEKTFENTAAAFDSLWCDAMEVANRIYLLKEVHPNGEIRESADSAIKKFQQWSVGIDYREDLYEAFRLYSNSNPKLEGERERFLKDTMRDYERSGMGLEKNQRNEVEKLRKKLSDLETDFGSNITKAQKPLVFSKDQLAGLPDSFLNTPGIRQNDGSFKLLVNVAWHTMMVMDHAKSEETRKKFLENRLSLCKKENSGLLNEILSLRQKIATLLGYDSWAHYKTEVRMAQSPERVKKFLNDLKVGLRDKFNAELAQFQNLKVEETQNPSAQIHLHDFRYYQNLYKKKKFEVDQEELRNFFPYRQVLEGMFTTFEAIFSLKIEPFDPGYKWADDLEAFAVSDNETGALLGCLYLDMFPREGKFNHFAQFGLIPGRRLQSGAYQCPVVALICNFALPEEGKPSLLTHNEVETLFHEFGHAMHSILTNAETNRYSGTGVDHDFVEVPSQMLEFWAWDKETLDTFARDYRDKEKTIPEDILVRMKAADKAVKGSFYTRQVSFSLVDMHLHRERDLNQPFDSIKEANGVLDEVFIKHPEDSAFAAYFGHLCGYDAGYYSYAWADAIAADLNTAFKKSAKGYQDFEMGKKLRQTIYQPGGSRDPNELVEDFLGRISHIQPFLESIGANSPHEG